MAKQGKRRVWLPQWASWFIYILLSILMTYPLVQYVNTHFGGSDPDIFNVYWGNWWIRRAFATGQNPYMTKHLIYPVGFDLTTFAFSPFLALLWIPLTWIVSPIAAYNLLVWATIILCCVAMDQLVRYLTGNPWAALVAGIAFGFASYLTAERAAHLNLAMVAWIPWAVLFLTRLMREAKIRDAILLAGTIVLSFLTRLHIGALVLVFSGVYFIGLTLVERERWHRLAGRRLLLAGLLSILILSPLFVHVWQVLRQPGAENLLRQEADIMQADLLAYIVPPPQHPLFGSWTEAIYQQRFYVNARYWAFVGFTTLLLLLYAVVSRPREALPWLLTGSFFLALALGPCLRFNGKVYEEIKLPYSLAWDLFSSIGFDVPNRFNLAMIPALDVLIGLACAQISIRLKKPWLLFIPATLILFEYLVVPIPLIEPPPHSPFYDQMAADGEGYAIVDLPLTREAGELHRYYQTIHNKPIVGGWDHRVPSSAFAFINENSLLRAWRETNPQVATLATALNKLSKANVRYIIVHKDQLRSLPAGVRSLFFTLRPLYEDDSIYVLPVEAKSSQDYNIVYQFNENVEFIEPSIILLNDKTTPILSLNTCWLFGNKVDTADGCLVTLTEAGGSIIDEKRASFPSSAQGLVCKDWSLEIDPPFQPGSYKVSITPLSEERPLGTYTVTQPIQVIQDKAGTPFPLMGYAFPVTFNAPIEMLGYNVAAGGDFLLVDLYWRSLTDHSQAYMLFVQFLDPATGQMVATNDDVIHKLEWTEGEIVQERRIFMTKDIPLGQYLLGVGLYLPGEPNARILTFDKRSGKQWPGNQAVLDVPILVLPRTMEDSPVSEEGRIVVYTAASEGTSKEPQHRVDVHFGDVAQLIGYSLEPEEAITGKELKLTLYWVAINAEPLNADYTVFTHLLDGAGKIIAQHDGEPVTGRRPTHTWKKDDKIIDTHKIIWQTQEYTGTATIEVGLYDFQTKERLPGYGTKGERLPHDRVILGDVEVK